VGTRGWPASLAHEEVGVRPLRGRDAAAWVEVRQANEHWLAPWEGSPASAGPPTATWAERHTAAVFVAMLRQQRAEARAGRSLPFAVTHEGRLVGQVTVSGVVRGAFDSCHVGYWVDGRVAGRGVMPTALALVVDHCFRAVGLHRVEANARPDNTPSRRVLAKLGFREEAHHLRYLFIDGAWRDHVGYALTDDDEGPHAAAGSVLAHYLATRGT
jgi:ribosomal-protein-alanine N-acetyltransferase